jgi:hypothetical protein
MKLTPMVMQVMEMKTIELTKKQNFKNNKLTMLRSKKQLPRLNIKNIYKTPIVMA